MRTFTAIIIGLTFINCSNSKFKKTAQSRTPTAIQTPNNLVQLKKQKDLIDSLSQDTNSLIVLAKTPHTIKLTKVENGDFPDEVEISYNILKDKHGKIIYIFEAPFSESGDWDIAYRSYYDSSGNIFAFERKAGFFNSECTDGAAHEVLVKLFNKDFSVLDSSYTLVDDNNKPLDKTKCIFNYDFPYSINNTVRSYRKVTGIDSY